MKPLAIRPGESPPKAQMPQPDQTPAVAREKLSALTHRIQLIIRNRPNNMLSLLEFYHYFLLVKEDLEHYFTREQSMLKFLHQAGTGQKEDDKESLPPDKTQNLRDTLARLKEELSDFVVLLSNIQINHKGLKAYSLALTLFFKELENFVRLLDAHNDQLSFVSRLLPPPVVAV
jgi:hypothetical protein